MRKTIMLCLIISVTLASVFCCCSQASTLSNSSLSCCHKTNTVTSKTFHANFQKDHSCECQLIIGALPNKLSKLQNFNFAGLLKTTGFTIHNLSSLAFFAISFRELCRHNSSLLPLCVKNSVLRI